MIGAVIGAVIILAVRRALLSAPGGTAATAGAIAICFRELTIGSLNAVRAEGVERDSPPAGLFSKNQNPRNLRCG